MESHERSLNPPFTATSAPAPQNAAGAAEPSEPIPETEAAGSRAQAADVTAAEQPPSSRHEGTGIATVTQQQSEPQEDDLAPKSGSGPSGGQTEARVREDDERDKTDEPAQSSTGEDPAEEPKDQFGGAFQPYVPFVHHYEAQSGQQDTSHPVIYNGPYPDSELSGDGDSAIGSFTSSGSVSLAAEAYQYRQMFGRRYHAYKEGSEYHLPNDERELDRLDLQHHCFLLMLKGALHKAPLPPDPHHVLDIGTGTGIWAIDFADNYPSAQVIGTDLSPVQPAYVPPNCRFYVEDAEKDWEFDNTPFDYIHSRMLVVAIRNWSRFFEQAFRALKPGGWIECQDLNFPGRCDDDTAPPDSPIMKWSSLMMEGASRFGIDLAVSFRFPELLAAAGFRDISVETHAWPVNRWPKEREMKTLGMWAQQNFLEGVQGFSMAFLARGLGWSPTEVEVFTAKVREQAMDRRSHVYLPISFFWARKPLDA